MHFVADRSKPIAAKYIITLSDNEFLQTALHSIERQS